MLARQGHFSQPIRITISNGLDSRLELDLRHYRAFDEDAHAHRIFRGLEAGPVCPTARSTSFSLQDGTLTAEKIDRSCDHLARDMILKESLGLPCNTLLNHILLFAVVQISIECPGSRIEGLELVRLSLRLWAIQALFFTYP